MWIRQHFNHIFTGIDCLDSKWKKYLNIPGFNFWIKIFPTHFNVCSFLFDGLLKYKFEDNKMKNNNKLFINFEKENKTEVWIKTMSIFWVIFYFPLLFLLFFIVDWFCIDHEYSHFGKSIEGQYPTALSWKWLLIRNNVVMCLHTMNELLKNFNKFH